MKTIINIVWQAHVTMNVVVRRDNLWGYILSNKDVLFMSNSDYSLLLVRY